MFSCGLIATYIFSTTIEAPQIVEMFPAYYIFNALLSVLLVLHTIWTYYILKISYNAIYATPVRIYFDDLLYTFSSQGGLFILNP